MIRDMARAKVKEIYGLMIFVFFVLVVSFVGFYFEITGALPAFMTSLFFIYILPKNKYSSLKNIIGSYIIASIVGFFGSKLISGYLVKFTSIITSVLEVTILLFVFGFIVIMLSMEHPPAIAVVLWWIFTDVNFVNFTGFMIGFFILLGIEIVLGRMHKNSSSGDVDMGKLDKTMKFGKIK